MFEESTEKRLQQAYQETSSMAEFLTMVVSPSMSDQTTLDLISWYQDQIKYQLIVGLYTKTYGDSRPTYVLIEPKIDDESHIYMMRVVETDDLKSRPGYRLSDFLKIESEVRNGWQIDNLPARLTKVEKRG